MENTMKKRRHLGGVLERLGVPKIYGYALTPLHALAVAGTQRPLLKDSLGFLLDILMYILGISLEIGRLRRI